MAHSFLKKMLVSESRRFQFQIAGNLVGGALLLNSYIADFIFDNGTISLMLAMMSALLLGLPLVWEAMRDLWRANDEINELAALSFLAAFCVGEYQTAAAIAFFMIIAELIEYRSQVGARKNIESLLRLSPHRACRIKNNIEEDIECSELEQEDVVRVRPGDNIPGDGTVIFGASSVNEASITGESIPVEKKVSDHVFGGSINISSTLEIKITAKASDTILAQIQKLILQAEESRTPLMRIIDQYAACYTPIILTIAALVLFFTRDINRSISILIIACPCTILLSSPTALVAALSAAARLGIIIKNVSILEIANKVDALVFDKTGTLTTGVLSVSSVNSVEGIENRDILSLAASVSFHSRHPVAQAILRQAEFENIKISPAENFQELAGFGVMATIDKHQITVGKGDWLKQHEIKFNEILQDKHEKLSILYIAKGKKYLGWFGLEDTIRPDALGLIDELRKNAIQKIVILTGDLWEVAKKIASSLKCEVEAEILPEEKMSRVTEIKNAGHVVAVVGDGVNDAPALAAGDVSIAMGAAGSDVAVHSASIVLMNEKLDRIPFIIHLSHRTINVIRQNLLFCAGYILLLLILSAFGIVHPVMAVILHTSSVIVVIVNSARLLREGEHLT